MADQQKRMARFLVGSPDEQGEIRAFCPRCEDPDGGSKTPSASFNFPDGNFKCFGKCNWGGSIDGLIKFLTARRRQENAEKFAEDMINTDRGERERKQQAKPVGASDASVKPLPTGKDIALWTSRLLNQPRLLAKMTEGRGLTIDTIKEYHLGHDGRRYTIPVYDDQGKLVNVRRYDPNAKKSADKMFNITGFGRARIFGIKMLAKATDVVMTEGEMDMILARQHGIPAITHTAGAGTFLMEWGPLFAGKRVWICYDNDDAGRKGANKVAMVLRQHALAVYTISIPVDTPGGDITDYIVHMGHTADQFRVLMQEAEERSPLQRRTGGEPVATGKKVSVEESMSTQHGNDPLEMIVAVAGKQNPPYLAPEKFTATCDMEKGPVCQVCPMARMWGGTHTEAISKDDIVLMEFIDVSDKAKIATMRKLIGARCSDHIEYTVDQNWSIEELLITNSVDHRGDEDQTPINRRVLNVGSYRTPINTTARIVGQQHADPKSQRGMFMSWMLEETQTNLDKFKMTNEVFERLKVFRPRRNQSPLDKCRDIAEDLAANVTHIYGRPELHVAYDLVWHSVLSFRFANSLVDKGWLEAIVMGDTRTGKSEAATQLSRHYNAGVVKSCEGATFAGIVGGVQQMGQKWMVTWGTIPLNDRRLVVLDEVSGLRDREVIENMSAIRSSGKAQLTKIATEETSARTRLIWISNPVDGARLHETPGSGMTALAKLVKNPEDIARFDFALAAAGSDVNADLINTSAPQHVKHRHTKKACEELVLWAWSRTADQVEWGEDVEAEVVTAAIEVGAKYVSDPPLIQIENVRMKLARIAVAIAARTFSSNETGDKLVVHSDHVASAVEFLDWIYEKESMGYLRQSRRILNARAAAMRNMDQIRAFLLAGEGKALKGLQAIGTDIAFRPRDFEEFAAMDRSEVGPMIQVLMEFKAIRRLSKGYIKMEQALIEVLRELEDRQEAGEL